MVPIDTFDGPDGTRRSACNAGEKISLGLAILQGGEPSRPIWFSAAQFLRSGIVYPSSTDAP
jgi:hypothetical protein